MTAKNLTLSLQHEEKLDPIVALELNQLIASLTTWAGRLGLGTGNINMDGMATFLGQPRVKLYKRTVETIATGIDTVVTWDVAKTGSPLEEYDDYDMFDGSKYVICKEPGLYVAHAEMQWANNAAGVRVVGIHPLVSGGIDYFAQDRKDGSAANGPRQNIITLFPVIKPIVTQTYLNFPLSVGVMVNQSSGGNLNIGGLNDRFGVWKVS